MFSFIILFQCLVTGTSQVSLSYALEDALKSSYRIIGTKSGKNITGTGFLVERPSIAGKPRRTVLVTAAHVLDEITENKARLVLRVSDKDFDGATVRKELPFTIRSDLRKYYFKHSELDIAAIAVSPPPGNFLPFIPLDQVLDGSPSSKRLVRLGREIWVASYPIGFEGNSQGHAIMRRGTIASIPSILFETKKPGRFIPASFLVDITNFGGDSGSPVLLVENGKPFVCGITIARLMTPPNEEESGKPVVPQGPLGISLCLQSTFIRDVIESVD